MESMNYTYEEKIIDEFIGESRRYSIIDKQGGEMAIALTEEAAIIIVSVLNGTV